MEFVAHGRSSPSDVENIANKANRSPSPTVEGYNIRHDTSLKTYEAKSFKKYEAQYKFNDGSSPNAASLLATINSPSGLDDKEDLYANLLDFSNSPLTESSTASPDALASHSDAAISAENLDDDENTGTEGGNLGDYLLELPLLPVEESLATERYHPLIERNAQQPASSSVATTKASEIDSEGSQSQRTTTQLEGSDAEFNAAVSRFRNHRSPEMVARGARDPASSPCSAASIDSTLSDSPFIAVGDINNGSVKVLLERQRHMQAKVMEMQIELDCARLDRDSAKAELASLSDRKDEKDTTSSQVDLSRELHALRVILQKKELALRKVNLDLASERDARARLEGSMSKQVQDFLQRFRTLQKHLQHQESRMKETQSEFDSKVKQLHEEINSQRDRAVSAESALKAIQDSQLKSEQATVAVAADKDAQLEASRGKIQTMTEMCATLRVQLDAERATNESREVEAAKSRAQLEDSKAQIAGLRALLQREGMTLQQHANEATQLATVVAAAREDVQKIPTLQTEIQSLQKALDVEKSARSDDARKVQDLLARQMQALTDADKRAKYWEELAGKQKEYISQLEKQYTIQSDTLTGSTRALEQAEQLAQYWQKIAHKNGFTDGSDAPAIPTGTLNSTTASMTALQSAQASAQNADMRLAQKAKSDEYASLWSVVQDMNRMDAYKEKAIEELLQQKQKDREKMLKLQSRYSALQAELLEIDRELISEAKAAGVEFESPSLRALVQGSARSPGRMRNSSVARERDPSLSMPSGTASGGFLSTPSQSAPSLTIDTHSEPHSRPTTPLLTSAADLAGFLKKLREEAESQEDSSPSHRSSSRTRSSSSTSKSIDNELAEAVAEAQEYDLCRSLDEINEVLERKVKQRPPALPARR